MCLAGFAPMLLRLLQFIGNLKIEFGKISMKYFTNEYFFKTFSINSKLKYPYTFITVKIVVVCQSQCFKIMNMS